ncbi:MAG TPA: hypothetical protein VNZ22_18605, partial [Bacillota bacterium]|nr:hypothetical protein [Bacillota bacterium]
SVGFIPLRWEDGTPKSGYRRKHVEQELLEVSAVAIPANPNALALGLKTGAIAKSDLRELAELCSRSLEAAPPCSQLSTLNPQLISLARQIRDLMKRA